MFFMVVFWGFSAGLNDALSFWALAFLCLFIHGKHVIFSRPLEQNQFCCPFGFTKVSDGFVVGFKGSIVDFSRLL